MYSCNNGTNGLNSDTMVVKMPPKVKCLGIEWSIWYIKVWNVLIIDQTSDMYRVDPGTKKGGTKLGILWAKRGIWIWLKAFFFLLFSFKY